MESLWNKYNKIKEVFYRDFVYDSSYTEQASCIPLSSVKDGVGWVGDGTINLAQYLQFLYTEIILGNKTEDDVCKWFGIKVKNNSYYCLGSTNEKSWYGPGFNKRLVKFFNKSLEGSELFMPHLVFLQEAECVEGDKLRAFLDKWEWDGVNSPIEFLILCNWYKIKFGK